VLRRVFFEPANQSGPDNHGARREGGRVGASTQDQLVVAAQVETREKQNTLVRSVRDQGASFFNSVGAAGFEPATP
jgi:hypothetical protein